MLVAALDFGSNSLKCLIAKRGSEGLVVLEDIRYTTRLAAALDNKGMLSQDSINRTINAAKSLLYKFCKDIAPQDLHAVGTETLRRAKNSEALIEQLQHYTGLKLKILSAAEEASFTWQGALSSLSDPLEEIVLFDSGGASTEIVQGINGKITDWCSIPLGAVSLFSSWGHSDPCSDLECAALDAQIDTTLLIPFPLKGKLVGTGGGIIACAKVATAKNPHDLSELDGFELSIQQLESQINTYKALSYKQRLQIPGMEPERSDIILPAAMLYHAILKACKVDTVTVSTLGLRQGLILSL